MKRLVTALLAAVLMMGLCACGAPEPEQNIPDQPAAAAMETTAQGVTTAAPQPDEPGAETLPVAAEGWQDAYLTFLDDNYDIFAAIWPGGLSGVGFIDLDLDGTPEMVVFDLGASATLGAQLFDLVEGQVHCISSVTDSASGAFGEEYFTTLSICASYFESFRLIRGEDGYSFWVESANGTLESAWDELIRFDCVNGVLTPVSVCSRYMESDVETGEVVLETYTVGPETSDAEGYAQAAAAYTQGEDAGYEAVGMFLWNNMKRYDTTYEGFMAMATDAATAYVPVTLP